MSRTPTVMSSLSSRRPARLAPVLAAALLVPGCAKKAQGPPQRPPANVTVAKAVEKDVPVTLEEVGKAVAREVVSIQPQVGGRIDAIHFTDGADVKKGDLL